MLSATAGARFAGLTATATGRDADSPPGSDAVTSTEALPSATPVIVSSLPATAATATAASELLARNVSESPSGSRKCPARSSDRVVPARSSTGAMLSVTAGAWFARVTVTATGSDADSPAGSDAVTLTEALPSATPMIVSSVPATAASATAASELLAPNVSGSPSGSRKCRATSNVTTCPTSNATGSILSTPSGPRFALGGSTTAESPDSHPNIATPSTASLTWAHPIRGRHPRRPAPIPSSFFISGHLDHLKSPAPTAGLPAERATLCSTAFTDSNYHVAEFIS